MRVWDDYGHITSSLMTYAVHVRDAENYVATFLREDDGYAASHLVAARRGLLKAADALKNAVHAIDLRDGSSTDTGERAEA